jgi:triosephosphate isomerase
MRRPLVAGNWKMHGTRASVAELIEGLRQQDLPADVEVAVFPSSLHIAQVVEGLDGKAVKVGAQDCAAQVEQGALTGELAAGFFEACAKGCTETAGFRLEAQGAGFARSAGGQPLSKPTPLREAGG